MDGEILPPIPQDYIKFFNHQLNASFNIPVLVLRHRDLCKYLHLSFQITFQAAEEIEVNGMNLNSLPIKCNLIHDYFNFLVRIGSCRRDAYLTDGAWFTAAAPPGNHTQLYIAIRNLLAQKKKDVYKNRF